MTTNNDELTPTQKIVTGLIMMAIPLLVFYYYLGKNIGYDDAAMFMGKGIGICLLIIMFASGIGMILSDNKKSNKDKS